MSSSLRRVVAITATTALSGALLVATGGAAQAASTPGVTVEANWYETSDYLGQTVQSKLTGTIYVADIFESRVRAVTTSGVVSDYAVGGSVNDLAIDQSTGTVFVATNQHVNAVIAEGVVTTFAAGDGSTGVAVDQATGIAYFASYWSQNVTKYDHGTVSSISLPSNARDIAVIDGTGKVYVTGSYTGNLWVIENDVLADTIVVDEVLNETNSGELALAVDQSRDTVWVTSPEAAQLVEIVGSQITRHHVDERPSIIAVNETTGVAYAYSSTTRTVTPVGDSPIAKFTVPGVTKIVADPSTGAVYFVNSGSAKIVRILDGTLGAISLTGFDSSSYFSIPGFAINPANGSLTVIRGFSGGSSIDRVSNATTAIPAGLVASTPDTSVTGLPYVFAPLGTGSPIPTYSIASGVLPAGLSLDPITGFVSGVPTKAGTRTVTLKATSGASSALRAYTFVTNGFSNDAPPRASLNSPYSFQFEISTNSQANVALYSGSLPTGLTLSSGGYLYGTPTETGSYTFTVTEWAFMGFGSARSTVTIVVDSSVTRFTSGAPNPGEIGADYSFTFAANGVPAPTYTLSGGTLPAGLTLDTITGVLSGTPTEAGASTFSVTAQRVFEGSRSSKTSKFTVEIFGAPEITSGTPTPALVGSPYSFTVKASGYPAPDFGIIDGTLPAGLSFDSSTGVISGTPTARVAAPVSITAFNGLGDDATEDYLLLAQSATSTALTLDRKATQTFGSAMRVTAKAQVALFEDAYPEGEVVFSDGDTELASVGVEDNGTASFALPATTTGGSHTITARFVPDSTLLHASTATAKLTVKKAASKSTLTLSKSSIKKNTTTTVTAKVVVNGVTNPAGTVSVYLGSKKLATANLGNGGTTTLTVPKFSTTGAKKLVLKYAGSSDIAASSAASKTLTVKK